MEKAFKIIVVDDDPLIGAIIQQSIKDQACDVIVFNNSTDFFSAFDNNSVQLAIIDDDLKEAEVDGLYILKDIMRRDRNVKVIALSGNDTLQKVLDYMDNEAWRYISKLDQSWPTKIELSVKEAISEFRHHKLMDDMAYEKAIELVLKKDELLNTFFNQFPALFAVLDSRGGFQMVNDKWKDLGWNRHDLKHLFITDLVCEECKINFNAHLNNSKLNKADFDCIVKTKEGNRIGINWQIIQNKGNYFCIGKLH